VSDPQGANAAAVRGALGDLLPSRWVTVTDEAVTALLNRKEDALYCHLINKDREESGFRPQTDFRVEIALPSDLDLADAYALYISPDLSGGEPALLPITHQNGTVEVTVPELEVYGVLVIPATQ